MDTRRKILTAAAVRQLDAPVYGATGYFDVLRAAHVRELESVSRAGASLMAIVLPLDGSLLTQRARAELVAALRVVDYVVAPDHEDVEFLIDALGPCHVARLEVSDAQRARQLIEHVHRRQNS